jgi:hypothetical protein
MSPNNLRVLRSEQSENHIPGLREGKDHMRHKSPLSVVDDVEHRPKTGTSRIRQKSWGEALSSKLPSLAMSPVDEKSHDSAFAKGDSPPQKGGWATSLPRSMSAKITGWLAEKDAVNADLNGHERSEGSDGSDTGSGSEDDDADDKTVRAYDSRREADKSLRERVKTPRAEQQFDLPPMMTTEVSAEGEIVPIKKPRKKAPIGTRLTMTSRVGYFQDRTISPSMVRIGGSWSGRNRADHRCEPWPYCTLDPGAIRISKPTTTSHRCWLPPIFLRTFHQSTSSAASVTHLSTTH